MSEEDTPLPAWNRRSRVMWLPGMSRLMGPHRGMNGSWFRRGKGVKQEGAVSYRRVFWHFLRVTAYEQHGCMAAQGDYVDPKLLSLK